jgi:hypothetical protein
VGQQKWVLYKLAQPLIHFGGFPSILQDSQNQCIFLVFIYYLLFIFLKFFFFIKISNVASYASITRGI